MCSTLSSLFFIILGVTWTFPCYFGRWWWCVSAHKVVLWHVSLFFRYFLFDLRRDWAFLAVLFGPDLLGVGVSPFLDCFATFLTLLSTFLYLFCVGDFFFMSLYVSFFGSYLLLCTFCTFLKLFYWLFAVLWTFTGNFSVPFWRLFVPFDNFSVPFIFICFISVLFWIFLCPFLDLFIPLYLLLLYFCIAPFRVLLYTSVPQYCIAPFRVLLYNDTTNSRFLRRFRKYRRIYTSDVPETDLLLLFREVSRSFTQRGLTVSTSFL